MSLGWRRALSLAVLGVLAVALSVALAACGSDNNDKGSTSSASSTPASTTETATTAAKCGLGNGQKATGEPIRIGAIVTKQAGTDFSDGPNMTEAYFNCVNDNGGINGRPVKMYIETEQTDPGQIASLAKKLVETDKVVAMVTNMSIIECAVNHKYWEAKGFYVLTAGIAPECYGTSNYAAVNMGPRYSSDGAVQAAIRAGAKKIAFDQSNVPGTEYIAAGPAAITKAHNVEIKQFKDTTPIKDANSVALKLVQAAGKDGSVVLNFTPPEALKILQAAQKLGLQDRVVSWGCSTPCNTDFVAKALGPKWDDKLLVNAELNVTDFNGADSALYRDVLSKYGKKVTGGLGSFRGTTSMRLRTSRTTPTGPPPPRKARW
jgi:branched-chain amino acid transport system substrate-binding protein